MTGVYAVFVLAVLTCTVEGRLIPQIVGGTEAEDGAYPYIVSLRLAGSHVCAGSIIDANNILTTAHCVAGKKMKDMKILAGTNNQTDEKSGITYSIEKIIIHKDFNLKELSDDIAILYSEEPIELKDKVGAVKFAPDDNVLEENANCTLIGWGSTRVGGEVSDNLQEINLQLISNDECKKSHPLVRESHICTSADKGEGACFGDSGGPLLTYVKSGEDPKDPEAEILVQIGILSFGRPCALGYPDGYTRVSSYKPWIEENKKKEKTTVEPPLTSTTPNE